MSAAPARVARVVCRRGQDALAKDRGPILRTSKQAKQLSRGREGGLTSLQGCSMHRGPSYGTGFGRCVFLPRDSVMREKIRLVSTAGTGFFYTTTKNRKNTPEKMLLKKYDPKIRQYVDFKEAKIK